MLDPRRETGVCFFNYRLLLFLLYLRYKQNTKKMKTKEELHNFIDGFTTRYAKRLSKGENMKHIYRRELMLWQNGMRFFLQDKEYTSVDGTRKVTIRGQFDEYDLWVECEDGSIEEVFADHDDYGEVFWLDHIQFKSY